MTRRYLDHNAGTPLGAAARAAMQRALDDGAGNPSSIHAAGREARSRLERARAEVAALVGAPREAVVFTAGGTEAIALGLHGLARAARARRAERTRVLIGASEHPAVLGAASALRGEGFTIEELPVDRGGRVRTDEITVDPRVALIAVQAVNHETGVVQPVASLAARARDAGASLLCDAVQAAGRVPVSCHALGASALCLASHKLYGPPGAGALVLGPGVDLPVPAGGGHQERGRRPGTEPLLAIVGFGAAATEARALMGEEVARQRGLRDELERQVAALGAEIFGRGAERVCNTTLCAFAGVPGQLLVMALDLEGFCLSTGAACTSGSVRPSAVLLAAGHAPERAAEAVRISIGRETTAEDLDALVAVLPALVERIRRAGRS